jgi:hypothetical protein
MRDNWSPKVWREPQCSGAKWHIPTINPAQGGLH